MILLAGNVFDQERALFFRENRNNLNLTSSLEKFSCLKFDKQYQNHSKDCISLHFLNYKMIKDSLAH